MVFTTLFFMLDMLIFFDWHEWDRFAARNAIEKVAIDIQCQEYIDVYLCVAHYYEIVGYTGFNSIESTMLYMQYTFKLLRLLNLGTIILYMVPAYFLGCVLLTPFQILLVFNL